MLCAIVRAVITADNHPSKWLQRQRKKSVVKTKCAVAKRWFAVLSGKKCLTSTHKLFRSGKTCPAVVTLLLIFFIMKTQYTRRSLAVDFLGWRQCSCKFENILPTFHAKTSTGHSGPVAHKQTPQQNWKEWKKITKPRRVSDVNTCSQFVLFFAFLLCVHDEQRLFLSPTTGNRSR